MKYIIDCRACGGYEVDMDDRPCFCPKCASASICVAPVKTKARLTAERKMFELDEIKPRLKRPVRNILRSELSMRIACSIYLSITGERSFPMKNMIHTGLRNSRWLRI